MPDYIVALHAALWRIPSGHEHAERRDLLREQLFRAYRWHHSALTQRLDAILGARRHGEDQPWPSAEPGRYEMDDKAVVALAVLADVARELRRRQQEATR